MKEVIVQRDFMGMYEAITVEKAIDLIKNRNYSAAVFQSDDRVIAILFWTPFGADEEVMMMELMRYFKYVNSITGIDVPEIKIQ